LQEDSTKAGEVLPERSYGKSMSLARKRARKEIKAARKGQSRGERQAVRVNRSVKGAYVYQLAFDMATRREALRNLSAVFLYTMHMYYGFGIGRLTRLRKKMQSEFDAIVAKNVTVEEITAFLQSEVGLDCGMAAEPKADHQRQIEYKAVKEMSAAFLMALMDEFGFKKKRLTDAYIHCAELSDSLKYGEITYDEITMKMERIMQKGGKKNEGKKDNAAVGR
jgi:hypothetical protein